MPKGGASSLTPVYAGLREDLDSFLKAYLTLKSVRFSDYKKLFEQRGMIQLFNGRSNSAEILEFNECLLVHCLQYMEEEISPGTRRTLNERLFGLYSLYIFFYVQQESHVVKVRMDPDAVRNFRKLTQILLEEKIYDAYMACLKLLEDKAIKHVAFIKSHDPTIFKRFYTDEKDTGVPLITNLNDPMSNVKALADSNLFNKLGVARMQYMRLKRKTGFGGFYLEDVQAKMRGLVELQSKPLEIDIGVKEDINTDHSVEKMASRGMSRTTIKEQAHAADLKLARYRRHRSANPIIMPIDSFHYEQDIVPETKILKRIKPEPVSPAKEPDWSWEPPHKMQTRQGIKIKREAAETHEYPGEENSEQNIKPLKIKKERQELIGYDDFVVDSSSDVNNMAGENFIVERKPRIDELVAANEINQGLSVDETTVTKPIIFIKPELGIAHGQSDLHQNYNPRQRVEPAPRMMLRSQIPTSSVKKEPIDTHEIDPSDRNLVEDILDSPKSILRRPARKFRRRVSFKENKNGELINTIHEIPARTTSSSSSSFDDVEENARKMREEADPLMPKTIKSEMIEDSPSSSQDFVPKKIKPEPFDDADEEGFFKPYYGEYHEEPELEEDDF